MLCGLKVMVYFGKVSSRKIRRGEVKRLTYEPEKMSQRDREIEAVFITM